MRRPQHLDLASDDILRGVDHIDRGDKGCIIAHLATASGLDTPPHAPWFAETFFQRVMLPTWHVPSSYHGQLRDSVERTIERLEWAILQDMQTYLGDAREALRGLGIWLTVDGTEPDEILHFGDPPISTPTKRKARVLPFKSPR